MPIITIVIIIEIYYILIVTLSFGIVIDILIISL